MDNKPIVITKKEFENYLIKGAIKQHIKRMSKKKKGGKKPCGK